MTANGFALSGLRSLTDPRESCVQESGKEQKFGFDYSYWSHDGFVEPEYKNAYLNPIPGSKYIDQNKVFSDLVSCSLCSRADDFHSRASF